MLNKSPVGTFALKSIFQVNPMFWTFGVSENVGSNILDTQGVQNIGLTLNIDLRAKLPMTKFLSTSNWETFVFTLFTSDP